MSSWSSLGCQMSDDGCQKRDNGNLSSEICHPSSGLWGLRYQIGGDRNHVFVSQISHHPFHQGRPGAIARTDLDVVELAVNVLRRSSDDRRHFAEPLEFCAMTNGAGHGLAARTGGHDHLALLDATGRHVGNMLGSWIAGLGAFFVSRDLDDGISATLTAAFLPRQPT